MREPESEEFIAFVWSECDFWRDEGSLSIVLLSSASRNLLISLFPRRLMNKENY